MDELSGIELFESSKIQQPGDLTTAYREIRLKRARLPDHGLSLKPFYIQSFLQTVNKSWNNIVHRSSDPQRQFHFVKLKQVGENYDQ